MFDFLLRAHEWEKRGQRFSRRDFGRMVTLLTAGATLPFYNEATLAQDLKAFAAVPSDAVKLNANENPMGPCPAALEAMRNVLPEGGRYAFGLSGMFTEVLATFEGLPASHVLGAAGSSDILHRSVLAFTSPSRPLVFADPGYESPDAAARFIGAKTIRVPLRKDYSHDAQAMAKADKNTGVIYVCNPNNPTGTITSKADIEFIVANKPEGCVVVIDEAYLHFTAKAIPSTDLVAAGKDVIVLRTFSKLYGMAGLRAGAAIARPDLLEKLRNYGGLNFLPVTGLAGAVASLQDKSVVPERRKIVADIRTDLCDWMSKKGYGFIPSEANMVLIDGKRPGRETATAMLKHKIAVGRAWASMPNYVRVTIGTRDEMAKFKTAFERVMES